MNPSQRFPKDSGKTKKGLLSLSCPNLWGSWVGATGFNVLCCCRRFPEPWDFARFAVERKIFQDDNDNLQSNNVPANGVYYHLRLSHCACLRPARDPIYQTRRRTLPSEA